MTWKIDALSYHAEPQPGKLSIVPTKPCETARDLSLAYSPGVAEPCLEIERDPNLVYKYTNKGNLVAVISNGTAVLGLGDIGPAAGKPVMEGKAVLFKTFADIDVYDLELDCNDPAKLVESIATLAPTFGGINLEDIKAPECFYVEEQLKKRLDIPVFHDDQHGTAIIAAAALLNALEITGKDIRNVRLVVNGAGAAAIACSNLLLKLGMSREQIIMCDTTGVIYRGRTKGMNPYKEAFAAQTDLRTLEDALKGADIFFGLSSKDAMSPAMLRSMAKSPIVFAMANPDPEIDYQLARETRPDAILATGRSDFPNQVNNVLGFPYIFRGALDVRARQINDEMKIAALHALAKLAKEPVPDTVRRAYGFAQFSFGPEYLIPKPFDPRALYYVAPAVAQAAMETGVARQSINIVEYQLKLKAKQNHGREMLSVFYTRAKKSKSKKIAFPEANNPKVMKAALMAWEEGIAEPVFVGRRERIEETAARMEIDISPFALIDPEKDRRYGTFVENLIMTQGRQGITRPEAMRQISRAHIFGLHLLAGHEVDGLICGVERSYPDMVKPILQIIGPQERVSTVAGMYMVSIRSRLLFFADTSMNIELNSEQLAEIAIMTAEAARGLNVVPRIAMLSFSNFGSNNHQLAKKMRQATELVRKQAPHFQVDGEMQADSAVMENILHEHYPFTTLDGPANVLIFPDMQSANISYKLLQRLGGARVVGPILLGLKAAAHVLQRHADIDEIFNMITVTAAHANMLAEQKLRLVEREKAKQQSNGLASNA